MAGIYGVSAYQQTNQTWKSERTQTDSVKSDTTSQTDRSGASKESTSSRIETKGWSPVSSGSSLIPRMTEYGNTIGDVQLSDKARDYYNKLKSKFHNMDFIAVSKDMKARVQANAASYGNANKMVVLIDEEKLERMATDESYRKKYEGIIAMSQSKLNDARNSLTSSGASVKNFGMSVDSNGKESFFATVGKSQDLQKKRIEKKAAEKKEQKVKDKKKAEKQAREDRIEKARDKRRSEKADKADRADRADRDDEDSIRETEAEEYVTIEAYSMDELVSKVQTFSYSNASSRVMTDTERMLGNHVDFKR